MFTKDRVRESRKTQPKAKRAKEEIESKRSQKEEKKGGKVLTFVDMSHLHYLSRSMAKPSTLQKPKGMVPKDTKQPILEDSSESRDSETETIVTDSVAKPAEVFSADKMALEIIEEMIKIVFEAEQENVSDHIISNDLLRQNVENIHKQRFVKIKLNEQKNEPMPSFAKKLPVKDSF